MAHRVCFKTTVLWFAMLLFTYFLADNVNMAVAGQRAYAAPGPYQITGIKTSKTDEGLLLRVSGSTSPTFTMYELFEPQRVILDIADGSFAESLKLPLSPGEGPVTQINGHILDDKEPLIARLEMQTAGDATYTVNRDANDIVISFRDGGAQAPDANQPTGNETAPAKPEAAKPAESGSQDVSMPGKASASVADPKVLEQFSYAGYEKQPITVDFYKIDLHNVFRLFGEISGMNIVIAQGVSGTLTLALENVPWDFVLDVILNLQNLQAIERYNTLVIAPKGREFEWPERKEEAVAFKKDKAILEETEKLQVTQKMEMSPEKIEAQKLTGEARSLEKQEEYEDALQLYEKAYAMWPENGRLAGHLASMYLVHMGMNAKAVYYGKEALKIDENDRRSALYTAIGLANMKKNGEAKEFFDLAVSDNRPESEALISYAMFSEESGNYVDALLLLARHENLFGDSLDTMIARARILDKEGNSAKATAEYRAILLSGYQLPADLTRYIKGRLAMENAKPKGQM